MTAVSLDMKLKISTLSKCLVKYIKRSRGSAVTFVISKLFRYNGEKLPPAHLSTVKYILDLMVKRGMVEKLQFQSTCKYRVTRESVIWWIAKNLSEEEATRELEKIMIELLEHSTT